MEEEVAVVSSVPLLLLLFAPCCSSFGDVDNSLAGRLVPRLDDTSEEDAVAADAVMGKSQVDFYFLSFVFCLLCFVT